MSFKAIRKKARIVTALLIVFAIVFMPVAALAADTGGGGAAASSGADSSSGGTSSGSGSGTTSAGGSTAASNNTSESTSTKTGSGGSSGSSTGSASGSGSSSSSATGSSGSGSSTAGSSGSGGNGTGSSGSGSTSGGGGTSSSGGSSSSGVSSTSGSGSSTTGSAGGASASDGGSGSSSSAVPSSGESAGSGSSGSGSGGNGSSSVCNGSSTATSGGSDASGGSAGDDGGSTVGSGSGAGASPSIDDERKTAGSGGTGSGGYANNPDREYDSGIDISSSAGGNDNNGSIGASLPEGSADSASTPDTSSTGPGNSYTASITPNGVVGLNALTLFTATFKELSASGDKLGSAKIDLPGGSDGFSIDTNQTLGFSFETSDNRTPSWIGSISAGTSNGPISITLKAADNEEGNLIAQNETVSVSFWASTPSSAGVYNIETRAWTDNAGENNADSSNVNNPAGGYNQEMSVKVSNTIQGAVDSSAIVNGDTIYVHPGSYTGPVNVNKQLNLLGAQAGVPVGDRTAGSNSESTIQGVMNVNAENVTIDGFTLTNPGGNRAVEVRADNATISNNIIHNIGGSNYTAANVFAVSIQNGPDNTKILNNWFDGISANRRTVGGVYVGHTGSNNSSNNLVIEGNTFNSIRSWGGSFFNPGNGAYAVLFNNGAGVNDALIKDNTIDGITGWWARGIGLEGPTPNAVITGNKIQNLNATGWNHSSTGVYFQSNPDSGSVKINWNSFTGMDRGVDTHWLDSIPYLVDASGNWWGTSNPGSVNIRAGAKNHIDFTPMLASGADMDPDAPGFQPDLSELIVHTLGVQTGVVGRIQEGVNAVGDAGTVTVLPGTYLEAVSINKPNITLMSTGGRDVTFIDNPNVGSETPGISVLANMGTVTVDGFTVNNFRNGIIQGMSQAEDTSFIVLNNKVIPEVGYLRNGIQVSGVGSQIKGNYVVGAPLTADWASSGIQVVNAQDVIVSGNTVNTEGADIGISVLNWSADLVKDIIIEDNIIRVANYDGIRISGKSGEQRKVQNVVILNNILDGNDYALCIFSVDLEDLSVLDNQFNDNTHGVVIFPSALLKGDILINDNYFMNAGYGVYNASQSIVNATLNYWGDPSGPSTHPGDFTTLGGFVLDPVTGKPADGSGDAVSENVHFSPWWINEAMTRDSDYVEPDPDPDPDPDPVFPGIGTGLPGFIPGLPGFVPGFAPGAPGPSPGLPGLGSPTLPSANLPAGLGDDTPGDPGDPGAPEAVGLQVAPEAPQVSPEQLLVIPPDDPEASPEMLVTADFVNEGTEEDLEAVIEAYALAREAFEANWENMGDEEYALHLLDLAAAWAAIQSVKARLSAEVGEQERAALAGEAEDEGDPNTAYGQATGYLDEYGEFLTAEQLEALDAVLAAVADKL